MARVPYEIVAAEADRLIIKMAASLTRDRVLHYWNLYISYIESCGWTDQEYDRETMKRIDLAWFNIKRNNWN